MVDQNCSCTFPSSMVLWFSHRSASRTWSAAPAPPGRAGACPSPCTSRTRGGRSAPPPACRHTHAATERGDGVRRETDMNDRQTDSGVGRLHFEEDEVSCSCGRLPRVCAARGKRISSALPCSPALPEHNAPCAGDLLQEVVLNDFAQVAVPSLAVALSQRGVLFQRRDACLQSEGGWRCQCLKNTGLSCEQLFRHPSSATHLS